MKNQKQRLQEYMQYKKISQNSIEKLLNLSNGVLTHINDVLSDNVVGKIVKYIPELNIDWILTGEGSMIRDNNAVGEGSMQNVSGSNNNVGVPTKKFEHESDWFSLMHAKDDQISRMQDQMDRLIQLLTK